MPELALLRHGQSEWNRLNRFTGWVDVGLTKKGEREALNAGRLLLEAQFEAEIGYTSYLKRAIRTLCIALDAMDRSWVEVRKDPRLNERHYGALQGLSKFATARKFGAEQVRRWRRGYDEPLPESKTDHPGQHSARYRGIIGVPKAETFHQAAARVEKIWKSQIARTARAGKNALVVAHGNSLRGLIMHLEGLTPEQIPDVELPTGQPVIYSLDRSLRIRDKRVLS